MNTLGIETKGESIFNIEATNRTNPIASRNLVMSACFDIKFVAGAHDGLLICGYLF